MKKKALVTGITGQDGSYLVELLLSKGYDVYGIKRRSSSFNTQRVDHINQDEHVKGQKLNMIFGDLSDSSNINHIIRTIRPDEIYNLAAQSHVRVSFDIPEYTADVTGLGALRIFEAIREADLNHTRVYQASSSEMYGDAVEVPQSENTPLNPMSPYASSKVFAYHMARNYRIAYNMFISNGILFNHESPRRGETFVTHKITRGVAQIKLGLMDKIYLGNLDAKRDWGYAPEFVEAMWLMLQQESPDDFVIATGETHTVKEFVERAFDIVKIDWKKHIEIDKRYFRPSEVNILQGDYSKAKKILGWEPKVTFDELVRIMVKADLEYFEKQIKK
ncbi:MAG: GDP-mannose 4,6-dehydratase [Candidatus Aureabacteria bacterium]|nr:GDP-mannose 4,6-dehydratase [Candidatus Auribacterota bacterium]